MLFFITGFIVGLVSGITFTALIYNRIPVIVHYLMEESKHKKLNQLNRWLFLRKVRKTYNARVAAIASSLLKFHFSDRFEPDIILTEALRIEKAESAKEIKEICDRYDDADHVTVVVDSWKNGEKIRTVNVVRQFPPGFIDAMNGWKHEPDENVSNE